MEFMDILNLILAIIAGLSSCIPLVISLVKYVREAIKEKNFGSIMKIVLDLIPEAEEKFKTGKERKEYIMNNIQSLSSTLEYDIDMDKISEMIDTIVDVTKKVNVNKK